MSVIDTIRNITARLTPEMLTSGNAKNCECDDPYFVVIDMKPGSVLSDSPGKVRYHIECTNCRTKLEGLNEDLPKAHFDSEAAKQLYPQ